MLAQFPTNWALTNMFKKELLGAPKTKLLGGNLSKTMVNSIEFFWQTGPRDCRKIIMFESNFKRISQTL